MNLLVPALRSLGDRARRTITMLVPSAEADERVTPQPQDMRCAECDAVLELHQVGGGVFVTWGNAPQDLKPIRVWCRPHMVDHRNTEEMIDLARAEHDEAALRDTPNDHERRVE